MKVIAKKGAKCPKEGKPRSYITDKHPVEIPNTSYYRRLIADGSLVEKQEVRSKEARGKKKIETRGKEEKK